MEYNNLLGHNKYTNNLINRKLSVQKAIDQLNKRDTQHPPDTFFIRRNSQMLERYLDENEYDCLKVKASEEFKPNYDHFKLK